MEEAVAELTHLARRSPEISQRSGVSVRVSVANMEVLEAAALKRAIRLGESLAAPRVSDLGAVVASTVGKVELESIGDESPEERIVERLITKALYATFTRRVTLDDLDPVVEAFEDGFTVETGERTPSREYVAWAREVPGLRDAVRDLGTFDVTDGAEEPAVVASAVEFLLEGLHLARRINKERVARRDGLPPVTAYTPDPRDLDGRVPPARHRGAADDDALAALARRARYSRWDGSQQVPDLGADEILDELSNDVMADGDLAEALRRLMERGWRSGDPTRPDLPGLQDLMDRLGRRREELRERFELGDVLGDIRRELDEIVAQERAGVERRLERSSGAPPDAPAPAPGASGDEAADGPARDAPTPTSRSCCATSPRSGSISWTPCRATSASGSATCASTTSWSPTRAPASTSSWSGSASRSWTSSSAG